MSTRFEQIITTPLDWTRLEKKGRSGSKARCHLLTHGTDQEVAGRLTRLIEPWGEVTAGVHNWLPRGFDDTDEAQLGTAAALIPDAEKRAALTTWWLAVQGRGKPNTPNWDIAATCRVGGQEGILLVEAKAHDYELRKAEEGKGLNAPISTNSMRNHRRIAACLEDASLALGEDTGLPWDLSVDWHYQMSNRFGWSWKLTELGFPVILVYLGFLNAEEMRKGTRKPIDSANEWEELVRSHSSRLFPNQIWDAKWTVNGRSFIPLIRAVEVPLFGG